jgi:Cys-rich four helix bundle protein (predicted Tat secretion target)
MDRRQALLSTFAGAAALSIAGRAVAGEAHAAQKGAGPNREVLESALHCARDGEVCLAHCLESFSAGDTMLAECARSVAQLVPACTALAQLAALKSPRLAEFAKAVVLICKDCEAQCRKHVDHHAFCKDCADSCLACIKACESLQ